MIAAMTVEGLPGCLIVTGMPGAGKSTVTRMVAHSLPRAARLDGDDLNEMIVAGRVWALGEPADEAAQQVELCNRNLCALAGNFADAGFTPVIDWVVPSRKQLDFFIELLAPRSVLFVVLAPGLDVCRGRDATRDPSQRVGDAYFAATAPPSASSLGDDMSRELGDIGWWFDTSALTPEQTAEQIVREAGRRALVV
jgi:predicted kinase